MKYNHLVTFSYSPQGVHEARLMKSFETESQIPTFEEWNNFTNNIVELKEYKDKYVVLSFVTMEGLKTEDSNHFGHCSFVDSKLY